MWRTSVQKGLGVLQIHVGCSRTSVTAATACPAVLPFSKIPKLPTVPILRGGWAYLPFIGKYDLFALHKANISKYKEYGVIYREEFSADLEMVAIHDPKDIEKVFRAEGKNPDRRTIECIKKYRDLRKDLYKNGGLLTASGEDWYEVRSQVQPHMMKPKAIHAYVGAMDTVSKELVDNISLLRGKNNKEIPDLLAELYKWALESVALVALDTRLGCLKPNPRQETTKMIQSVAKILEQLWKFEFGALKLWKKFPTPSFRKFTQRMDFFSQTVQKYLDEAMLRIKNATDDHEATFLEQMISTSKDPRNVNATITDMFLAGIDTTSTTVGLTLYHLARNPEAQEKAFKEVKDLLKDNKEISLETINAIKYLKACVKEAMRLTPIVIGNGRKTIEDTVLSGHHIPAGTEIFMQGYVTGLDANNFPEPNRFLPDRFLREESNFNPFAYLPFSFGPRSCVGRRIAEQEIWTLLIRILERYRMEYHHEEVEFVTRAVITPDRPLRVQFFDR